MSKSQKKNKHKESHASSSPYGLGDYYGTGIKAKVGKVVSGGIGIDAIPPEKLKIPPKALA